MSTCAHSDEVRIRGGGWCCTRSAGSSGQDLLPDVLPLVLFFTQVHRAQLGAVSPPFLPGVQSSELGGWAVCLLWGRGAL